jgi:hypothetical protein
MTHALLAALLAVSDAPPVEPAQSVAAVQEEPEPPPPVWEVYVGANGGMRVDNTSGGGGVMLGVNRKFFNFLRPELMVASSTYAGRTFDYVIQIRIGARFELPLDSPWKPYLWTAFAHNHESPWTMVVRDPFGHLFGLSNHGVHHRSGIDLGLGVAYEVPRLTKWKIASRIGSRLTFTQFFGDSGPPRYLDFTMTVGVAI